MEPEPGRAPGSDSTARLVIGTPTSTSAPNKGLRSYLGPAAKSLHPAQAGGVQETEFRESRFRRFPPSSQAGAIKPTTFRGRKARSARPRCSRIEASSVDRVKKFAFSSGVNLGGQFLLERVGVPFFPLMKIAVQDRLVTGFDLSCQPISKCRIFADWSLMVMIGNDQERCLADSQLPKLRQDFFAQDFASEAKRHAERRPDFSWYRRILSEKAVTKQTAPQATANQSP